MTYLFEGHPNVVNIVFKSEDKEVCFKKFTARRQQLLEEGFTINQEILETPAVCFDDEPGDESLVLFMQEEILL